MCIHIYDIVKKYNSVSFQNLSSQDKKKPENTMIGLKHIIKIDQQVF